MNKILKATFLLAVLAFLATPSTAKENIGEQAPPRGVTPNSGFRSDCNPSISKIDLDINNVRARLLGGGDLWWDLSDGRYIIPNVAAGEKEVSSIFAAAIWIGGVDAGSSLKIAAQTYRQGGNDFWPGPINPDGTTDRVQCSNWDQHFKVLGENIEAHIADYLDNGVMDKPISPDILNWPGRGNDANFERKFGFSLPDQDLAPFYDINGNEIYDPEDGEFPVIGVDNCGAQTIEEQAFADQMIWWVYNDVGNIHSESGGDQIGMEIQALAFAYKTNDEINNMSFYKYKLLNKAQQSLFDTYLGNWVDPDLGCWDNDFVGCDVDRALGVVYNGEATDPDCPDFNGGLVNGYGVQVPMLGVDYFEGPKDENGNQLGMSAFVYYNNDQTVQGNPNTAQDFYGYLSGFWRDQTPIQEGGDGYDEGTPATSYMFPSDPSDNGPDAWSECSETNDADDRRFVQSSGPFRLDPGASNNIIVGAVWVPEADYPCPSFTKLQQADDKAQGLFDNCFKVTEGPDAPDLTVVELDREIVLTITNDPETSNNYLESYSLPDPAVPSGFEDSTYRFQGYKIYQKLSPNAPTISELNDPTLSRLVASIDVKDGIVDMYNYVPFEDGSIPILVPTENDPVEFEDSGIYRSISIKNDAFSGARLTNHKKYYFTAISYAYNDYVAYDAANPDGGGQQTQYKIGDDNIQTYIGIPHINTPENNGTVINANYGDQPQITRIDGVGHSGTFLDLTDETVAEIVASNEVGKIVYKSGAGPLIVKVINPLKVTSGTYSLTLIDDDLTDNDLDNPVNWILENQSGDQWFSERPIDFANEQIIQEAGISVQVVSKPEPGVDLEGNNGYIGSSLEYADPNGVQWFSAFSDGQFGIVTNFLRNGDLEEDEVRDPKQVYSNVLGGRFYPYPLVSWKQANIEPDPTAPPILIDVLTPAWTSTFSATVDGRNKMEQLNNVDIVYTSDTELWSRCVVVNTFSNYLENQITLPYDVPAFKARGDASVNKKGEPDNTGTTGMSYFPGYAIDVETGQRLNIFFGENPFYNNNDADRPNAGQDLGLPTHNGKDMIWNPNSDIVTPTDPSGPPQSILEIPLGGQHFVYVTKEPYDECASLRAQLDASSSDFSGIQAWTKVSWTTIPLTAPGTSLLPMSEGLIPNDVTVKLRVDNTFDTYEATNENNAYPKYNFSFDGLQVETEQAEVASNGLDLIRVVPNPYYAFSAYENGQNETKVKITNLPAKCKISIFSLDGKLIRTYNRFATTENRDETRSDQIDTFLEWDLKNQAGILISSGVYIIHIDAEGIGEQVVKWFGSIRQFDSSGL